VKPSKLFAFTLGTLSAIGGFIDIGDLVADAQVGARFGLRLAWVTVLSVVGIACYAEMSARITIQTRRPAFDLIRSRLGPRFALVALVGAFAVTGLLVMAELSGVAFALQLATSLHYLLWVPVAAVRPGRPRRPRRRPDRCGSAAPAGRRRRRARPRSAGRRTAPPPASG
jgi:hypothetical protein